MKTISLIIPFFNEEESVESFFNEINKVVSKIDIDINFEFICVDDGSTDGTIEKLIFNQKHDQRIKIIELSRNFGKEAALTAGIYESSGDAIIPIDADLQDPPELIQQMIEKWLQGYEVVLAKRENRESDSFFKRITANFFYKIHNNLSTIKIPSNVGDFRLLDKCVVQELKKLPENQRFMKGLFAWVGFKSSTIYYTRTPRAKGRTKFSSLKLINLAIEGITSFSTAPLRIFSYLGFFGVTITSIYACIILFQYFLYGIPVKGYTSIMISVLFLGNLQLMGIGILGEYLGRTYIESKRRPIYIIRKIYK
jgi:glycosyltransferase involved in cell wall biosynthesis